MQDRGILPSVVENTIRTGNPSIAVISDLEFKYHFYDAINDVTVIINEQGGVITVSYGCI